MDSPSKSTRTSDPSKSNESTGNDQVDEASVFSSLYSQVDAALSRESAQPTFSSQKTFSTLSVNDLKFNESTPSHQPEPVLLDLLMDWKDLLNALQKANVFGEYVALLEHAFSLIERMELACCNVGRSIHTLLELLVQAVKDNDRDKSIECRFVTLLEVVLSYEGSCWHPSPEVSAMWKRLMQRVPDNIAPVRFRRKAYRVLVSLSWVISSKGLLEACSFEESKQVLDFSKEGIREHMAAIQDGPLPRFDCVNQLLDRLKDETDVCVAITSEKEGFGKTTLVGQVASHPAISRVFTVLWLNVKREDMGLDLYLEYLTDLCKQMCSPEQKWPVKIKRFEESAIRRLRERELMTAAKATMSEIFARHDRNVLLVLDDVTDSEVVKWFRFDIKQSIILTTPLPNLPGVDWTLELVPMCQGEAVDLFLKEAGLQTNDILGATVEVRDIVKKCDRNPLIIRTVARWYQLKQVTTTEAAAVQEILVDLNALRANQSLHVHEAPDEDNDPNMLLFDVLCLMMGPVRVQDTDRSVTSLFLLCFAAQVVVFPDAAPLDAVLLLWEKVLTMETMATDELGLSICNQDLKRQVWLIAEGLTHMGVINVVEDELFPMVKVHHFLYRDFAVLMAREMNVKETFQETVSDWHKAFVMGYVTRTSALTEKEKQGTSWKYVVEKLPSHMFEGKMLPTAAMVLADETFLRARTKALGWRRGIETQIDDCILYQRELEAENEVNGTLSIGASKLFEGTASLLSNERIGLSTLPIEDQGFEEAWALYSMGFALTENGYFEDALVYFKTVESLIQSPQQLQTLLLYAMGWSLLLGNRIELAKTKILDSQRMMSKDKSTHGLYMDMRQLYADALIEGSEYKDARSLLDDIVKEMKENPFSYRIELGTALYKHGRLLYLMKDNDSALDALEECVKWKVDNGETSRELATALGLLGDVYLEMGLLKEASDRYDSALHTLESLNYDSQQLDGRLLTGKLQYVNDDFPRCKQSFELVRRTSIATPLHFMNQSAYDLRYIARVYADLGDFVECKTVLHESQLLTEDRKDSLERACGMIDLGNCMIRLGNDEEALSFYEAALEIQTIKLQEDAAVIDTVNLIGSVHMCLGNFAEALQFFENNYRAIKRIAPDDVERKAGVLFLMGDANDANNSFDAASSCFINCLATLKCDRNDDHPDIAKTLHRLGDVYKSGNFLAQSFDFYSQALKIRLLHGDLCLVSETNHCLGVLAGQQGDIEASEKYLLDALTARAQTGVNKERSETLLELGHTYRMSSQPIRAISLYTQSLAAVDGEDPLYGLILLSRGLVNVQQGNYVDSLSDYESARLSTISCFGMDDIRAVKVSRSIGLVRFLMGDMEEACKRMDAYIRTYKLDEVSPTVDVALTHLILGDAHDARGDINSAMESWTNAEVSFREMVEIREDVPTWISSVLESRLSSETSEYVPLVKNVKAIRQLLLSMNSY